jgi:hypothetical protein
MLDSEIDCDYKEPQPPAATPHPESTCNCEVDPICVQG